jgi:hypothetical protein
VWPRVPFVTAKCALRQLAWVEPDVVDQDGRLDMDNYRYRWVQDPLERQQAT